MKHKMITKRVNVALTQSSAVARVSQCVGLREATVDGRNVLTVSPRLESMVAGCHTPLAAFYDVDGREHLLLRCSMPFSGLTVWSEGVRTDFVTDAGATCALAVSNGFVVMTSHGPAKIMRDALGRWSYSEHFSFPAQVRLTAQRVGQLSGYTKAMSLSGTDFSRIAPSLSDSGEAKLTSALAEAYGQLADSALASCNWIQPFQARYRLIGESGEILYSSVPVAICPDGWQADSEISVVCAKSGSDTLEVPGIGIVVNAFRMNIEISEDSLAKMRLSGVKSIEIWATPQIHPFDPGAQAAWRISRETTDAPALTVAIPGATTGFSPWSAMRLSQFRRLEQMIDDASQLVTSIDIDTIAGPFQCLRTDSHTVAAEIAAVAAICESGKPATVVDSADPSGALLSEIASPHSFMAATVAVSGDTVVWGDITPLPAQTVSIEDFTTDFASDPYEGVLAIERTDGSRYAMAIAGAAMPASWAPQVCYPESGVKRIELYLSSKTGDTRLRGELSLLPGTGGLRSVYLNSGLESTPLSPWTGVMPATDDTPAGKRRPGALVSCRLTQPLLPLAALECCHSPVRAIHPALRSRSGWDFSRARFYALSADAVHAVSIAPKLASVSASAMDSRGVTGGNTSVYTPLGVMALHCGNLLKISGAGVDTIATGITHSQLAWDDGWQALWLLSDNGDMRMYDPKTHQWADIASPGNFIGVSTVGNHLWLTDYDELYRPETRAEHSADTMRRAILWSSDVALPDATAANAIELKMSGSYVELVVTISAQPGPALHPARQLLKFRISGPVSAPLIKRFPALRRPFLSLSIEGTCNPDFRLHSINFKTVSHDN